MEEIRRRGAMVITEIFTQPVDSPLPACELPPVATPLPWTGQTALVRQVDRPRLLAEAVNLDGVIEIHVNSGGEVRRGLPRPTVHAAHLVDGLRIAGAFMTGSDRTFAQDPVLAFRLLSYIGDRALSPQSTIRDEIAHYGRAHR